MKYSVLFLILFTTTIKMFAQHTPYEPKGENGQQEILGQYGGSDGILLFEDGRFALYGYATFIMGCYSMDNGIIEFKPDIPELYAVYGFHNPKLKGTTQMMFQGFEDGENYVQFDHQKPQLVFNKDANCFDWPFIHRLTAEAQQITFDLKTSEYDDYSVASTVEENQWKFTNEGYNDLIFVFNKPIRYHLPFKGMLLQTEEKEVVLQLSANFGDRLLPFTPKAVMNEWDEALQLKNVLDASSLQADAVYTNEMYNMQPFDPERYLLDEETNLLIDTLNTREDAELKAQRFEDIRFLKKYVKLKPTGKASVDMADLEVNSASIFYTTCEEPEKSYKNPCHQK